MARDFRLRTAQDLHEVADANLLVAHEVQQPEPGVVPERLKEPLACRTVRFCCHILCIRLDECDGKRYIQLTNVCGGGQWQSRFWIRSESKYGAVAESTLSNERRRREGGCGSLRLLRRGADLNSGRGQHGSCPAAIPLRPRTSGPVRWSWISAQAAGWMSFWHQRWSDRKAAPSAST